MQKYTQTGEDLNIHGKSKTNHDLYNFKGRFCLIGSQSFYQKFPVLMVLEK